MTDFLDRVLEETSLRIHRVARRGFAKVLLAAFTVSGLPALGVTAAGATTYSVPYPLCNVSAVTATTSPGDAGTGLITLSIGGGNAYTTSCNQYDGFVGVAVLGGSANGQFVAIALGDGATATASNSSIATQGVAIAPFGYAQGGNVDIGCTVQGQNVSSQWCPFFSSTIAPIVQAGTTAGYSALGFPACTPLNYGDVFDEPAGLPWTCSNVSLSQAIHYDAWLPSTLVVDNTGVADVPTTPDQIADAGYSPPSGPVVSKETLRSEISPAVAYALITNQFPPTSPPCPDGDCAPKHQALTNQSLVSQETTYTCGPASSRLVLWQMTGTDPGESGLAADEHTSSKNGTWYKSIEKTLNARQSQDVFSDRAAGTDPSDYMSTVVSDIHYGKHGLINNVYTPSLSFWGGHPAKHYDVSYGYDLSDGGTIGIAEEWDPSRFHISLRGYGNQNPYGYHASEPLQNVWTAVRESPSGVVIW